MKVGGPKRTKPNFVFFFFLSVEGAVTGDREGDRLPHFFSAFITLRHIPFLFILRCHHYLWSNSLPFSRKFTKSLFCSTSNFTEDSSRWVHLCITYTYTLRNDILGFFSKKISMCFVLHSDGEQVQIYSQQIGFKFPFLLFCCCYLRHGLHGYDRRQVEFIFKW